MENAKMRLLKDLKQENILASENLDDVAAGSCYQMADDSHFLNRLLKGRPERPDCYDAASCFSSNGEIQEKLTAAWAAVGIEAVLNNQSERFHSNRYLLNGVPITHYEACAHAEKVIGAALTD